MSRGIASNSHLPPAFHGAQDQLRERTNGIVAGLCRVVQLPCEYPAKEVRMTACIGKLQAAAHTDAWIGSANCFDMASFRSLNPMDNLASISAFVRAAETRNFSEAARQLGMSSSAIGKAVSRLEDRLGVRLFHRSTRSATLTAEGQLFLARCMKIQAELEAAEVELSAGRSPRGLLRVSLPMVGTFLTPVLSAFIREYPEIRLDLDISDRIVDVIDDGFDVVLRTGEGSDSRLVSRVLGYYRPMLIASPGYLKARGTPVKPGDLARHAAVVHRFPSTGKVDPWLLQEEGEPIEVPLDVLATASAVEPLVDMAIRAVGIAYVPDFFASPHLKSGALVEVLPGFVGDRKVFRALWPSGKNLSPKVRVLVDYLSSHLFPIEQRER